MSEDEDTTEYVAVISGEDQYSIWPSDRELPFGWSEAGKRGTRAEVLAWIEQVWTDMRPQSLREQMEQMRRDDE